MSTTDQMSAQLGGSGAAVAQHPVAFRHRGRRLQQIQTTASDGPRLRAGLVPPHDLRADARPPLLAKASSTPVPPPGWPCTAQKVRVPKNHCGSRSPACPKGAPGLAPHQRRIRPATRRSYGRAPATWRSPHSDALEHNPGQGAQHPHPAPVRTIRRARTHRHAGYGTEPALAARAGRAQEPIRLIWSASRPSAGLRPERLNEASCAARTIGPRPTLPMSALPARLDAPACAR